ncbi:MAG TPA: hypothetical protein VK184_03545 [Nostocaceae cyanobacterium]|nr:hypothetical protein [Nostocaceae cyanobacterium]
MIHENRTVERLYLGGNNFDEEDAELLGELLRKNSQIKALLLNVNHLGDAGVLKLAAALQQNQTLVELGLASNGITVTGCKGLIEVIKTNSSLINLDLGYSPSTKVLGVKSNNLGDVGAEIIGQILPEISTLVKLDLRRNHITEKGKQALIAGLEKNYTLCQLIFDGKEDERVTNLLQRNCSLKPEINQPNRDISLIKSVYRTSLYV